jgi:hypothetical protein
MHSIQYESIIRKLTKHLFMKTGNLITLIILTIMISRCTNTNIKMEDKLRGMWKLDKFESYDSLSGTWIDDITRIGYTGFILYDGLGHMAVHLMPAAYNDFDSSMKTDSVSQEELISLVNIYKSNYVYFADYTIKDGEVYHTKLSATNPKDKGSIAVREFGFLGDTLILKPKEKINGLQLRLCWVKCK